MTRTLLVLRHAKSAWDTDAATDFDRPLAKRGKQDAPRIGKWLSGQCLPPQLVVSSPAKRAKQTAARVCHELGIEEDAIQLEERIYEAEPEALLDVLADIADTPDPVLIVGHNPGLELLVRYLCANRLEEPEDGKLLPTATVAVLQMPDDWSDLQAGSAQLLSITRPRSLPAE